MIRKYIIEADDSIKGFDGEIAKLEREWGAEEIEPSEDCIRREKTLNKINELLAEYILLMPTGWTLPLNIAKTINELPPVTPSRPKGKWIDDNCSICGYGVKPWNNTPYCPNCGADMRGEDNDNK